MWIFLAALLNVAQASLFVNLCDQPIEPNQPIIYQESKTGITVLDSQEKPRYAGFRFQSAAQIVDPFGTVLGLSGEIKPRLGYRRHEQRIYKKMKDLYGPPITISNAFLWVHTNHEYAALIIQNNGASSFHITCDLARK